MEGRDDPTDSIDPLSSILADDIRLQVGEFETVIDYTPAAGWIRRLVAPGAEPVRVVLSMAADQTVNRAAIRGAIAPDDLGQACRSVLERASGRRWWVAMNIVLLAMASWTRVGGELSIAGVDANRVTLGAWIDAVWLIIMRDLDEEKANQVISMVGRKPSTGDVEQDLAVDDEDFERIIAASQRP